MNIYRYHQGFVLPHDSAVMIGNFDGVHKGHQAMVARLLEKAKAEGLRAVAMSFFPHTRRVLEGRAPALLTSLRDRAFWLDYYGIEDWVIVPFTPRLRHFAPIDFVRDYLLKALRMRALVVGDDFRFGYQGRGDGALLSHLGGVLGFDVERMAGVVVDGVRVSSSLIRDCLLAHDLPSALRFLGHDLSFTDLVRRGSQMGRRLQARTMNLHVGDAWCLPDGVYVVKIRLCDGFSSSFWGVANLGASPTFASTRRKLEVHAFADLPELYGQRVQVCVVHFLRTMRRFANARDLAEQIQKDILDAKHFIGSEIF